MFIGTTFVKAVMGLGLTAALLSAPVAMAHEGKGRLADVRARIELRKEERKPAVKPIVRSHAVISASGKVHIIGAKVTSVAGTVINATTQFGSTTVAWTINAANAKVGAKATTTASIVVGDTISVGGTIGSSLTTVVAKTIREH